MVKKERIPKFKNVEEAYNYLQKKEYQKRLKKEALRKIQLSESQRGLTSIQRIGQAEALARQRERAFQTQGSKAEQIENYLCSINEVPLLQSMERARARACSPPDEYIKRTEKSVTDSFPD